MSPLRVSHSIVMPAIPSNKPYRVGRSRTGLGLFATKPIKKGTKIIRYFGPLLDSKKKKDDAIENKYLFELNNRWTIDGSVRKNIEPGEEINYDYGTDYFKAYLKPIGCKCAACEKKRKKQRAEARAEKARLKAKAERKAQKQAEKRKAKAAKAKEKAKAKQGVGHKLNGHANGATLNGHSLNGHARKILTARSSISAQPTPTQGRESRASA